MRKLTFLKTRAPASEADIRDFERRWELKLPSSFRQFCLEVNGGMPDSLNDFFPVESRFTEFWDEYGSPDGPVGVGVAWFESIVGDRSVDHTMQGLTDSGQLLPNRVPFAHEGCGNLLMLSVAAEDFGAVYYWEHEFQKDFRIADSFDDFMDGLSPYSR